MFLPERVTIHTRSVGAGPVTWTPGDEAWAAVESQPMPTEGASASGLRSTVQYLVTLRARTLTPEQRLTWRGRVLQIHGVRPLDKASYLEVLCSEVS